MQFETLLLKKTLFRVRRKLRTLQAIVPVPAPDDAALLEETGGETAVERLNQLPSVLRGCCNKSSIEHLRRRFGTDCDELIADARRKLNHQFDLLGSGLTSLGDEIDWSMDFKSGKRWDHRDYRLQKIVDLSNPSDVKVPWELSRCNHFPALAVAYRLTGDHRFVVEFERQLISWARHNHFGRSVNWTCAMETAFRCVNWILAYQILSQEHQFSEQFRQLLVVELYKGGKFISNNLEKTGTGYNTNHYISDLVGLLVLGELFAHTELGRRWRQLAHREMETEMITQVDEEGLDYESSLPYHGLVTELFLFAHLFARRCSLPFSDAFTARLKLMLANLQRFTRSDGQIEPFGDADDGRLLRIFPRHPRDFRDLLAVGQLTFSDLELMNPKNAPEAILYADLSVFDGIRRQVEQAQESFHLRSSGICRLRNKDLVVNFFANPVGTGGLGNHKHNDLLSFTLEYKGKLIFIDPGTYLYTADEQRRNQFRSTRAHNTVMVDGQEQNRMVGGLLFLLRVDGQPQITLWEDTPHSGFVIAEHDCYDRLADPVLHRRSLYFNKESSLLLIRDELLGEWEHEIEFNFCISDITVEAQAPHLLRLLPQNDRDGLLFQACDPSLQLTIGNAYNSPSYGTLTPCIHISSRTKQRLPFTQVFAVVAVPGEDLTAAQDRIVEVKRALKW